MKNQELHIMKRRIKDNITLLINNGQLEEAKGLINEYKKIVQDDSEIYSMLSVILIMEGNFNEAEGVLKEGIAKDNSNFDLIYNLGYLYENKNNITEAKAMYNMARMLTDKMELIEMIDDKVFNLGKMKPKYNVILFGDYFKCLELKNKFYDWNVIAICNDERMDKIIIPSDLIKYNYDFIFVVDELEKEEVYKKIENYNDKNIYFMEDFKLSVIEGLDYRILQLVSQNKIDGIITGLSYAEVGIKENLLPYNFVNFALSSQDLYYDFLLLKYLYEFEEVKNSLKYVIINLSYYSFDYDMTMTISKYRIHRYIKYFNEYHNNNDSIGVDITRSFYEKRITFKDYMEMNETKENTVLNVDDINGIYEAKRNSSMNYESTRAENERILESYLSFLSKNNIKPIIIICPTSSHYKKYFDTNKKNIFYDILNSLNKKYDFQIIDYFESKLFEDDDFWDYSHLNGDGAKKFTEILNEKINW